MLNHPPKASARVLAPNGMLIPNSIGYTGGLFAGLPRMARAVLMGLGSTTVKLVFPAVNRENLDALLRLLESGEVRAVIDKTYPLDQAAGAVTHMLDITPAARSSSRRSGGTTLCERYSKDVFEAMPQTPGRYASLNILAAAGPVFRIQVDERALVQNLRESYRSRRLVPFFW